MAAVKPNTWHVRTNEENVSTQYCALRQQCVSNLMRAHKARRNARPNSQRSRGSHCLTEECLEVFYEMRAKYMEIGGTAVMEEKLEAWENANG